MSLNHGPSIATSGLTLYLDAANIKSYPGSGTTWFDLSGNKNNLTLQNTGSISYNASGYFSTGATGYFSSASSTNTPTGNSPYCIGVWARQTGTWGASSNGFISIGGFGVSSGSNALRTLNNTAGQFHHYWWNNDLSVSSSSATLGNWFMVLAQFNGTTRSVWVNNVQVASDTPTGHNVTSSALQVSLTHTGEYQQGDIASAFIYNTALTPTQIAQNYNALRRRYGI
jgi:hypothetical protein